MLALWTLPAHAGPPLPEKLIVELDTLFATAQRDARVPSLVYGVVDREGLRHVRAYGVRNLSTGAPATADTGFRIASMTKLMTALLVHDLADQGRLSLDDPAEKYVAALAKWRYPTADSRRVLVRDLVNHTAGFVTDDPWADRRLGASSAELDRYLADADPFSHAPGTHYEYSNLGYVILGRLIENVTGRPYAEWLRQRLVDPLQITDTHLDGTAVPEASRALGYNWTDSAFMPEPFLPSGAFDPLGGVWTTARDYARFVAWVLGAWPPRSEPDGGAIPRRVVRSVTDVQRMRGTAVRPGPGGTADCVLASGYAMGVSVATHCSAGLLLSHSGGFPGYGSFVLMSPDLGLGVFAFTNGTYSAPSGYVWEAVAKLIDSGHFRRSGHYLEPADGLLDAYSRLKAVYAEGDIEAGGIRFADNFLLDRSKERWNRQLRELRREAGECDASSGLEHGGRLAGQFTWHCATARVTGRLALAPVGPAAVQYLHIRTVTLGGDGREIVTDFDFH